jgi:hypothetical protein
VAGLLEADPELRRYGTNVEVSGGRVVLAGIVDSEAERERADTFVRVLPDGRRRGKEQSHGKDNLKGKGRSALKR